MAAGLAPKCFAEVCFVEGIVNSETAAKQFKDEGTEQLYSW